MKILKLMLAIMLTSFNLFAQTDCIPDYPDFPTDTWEDVQDIYGQDDWLEVADLEDSVFPHYCHHCGLLVCDFPYPDCFYNEHEWWCPAYHDYFMYPPCRYSQVEDNTEVIFANNGIRDSNGVVEGGNGCGCTGCHGPGGSKWL